MKASVMVKKFMWVGAVSLLVATGVALTFGLWPAALAVVATGLSLSAVVGVSAPLQIGLLTSLATAGTYVVAGIAAGLSWIKSKFCSPTSADTRTRTYDFRAERNSSTEEITDSYIGMKAQMPATTTTQVEEEWVELKEDFHKAQKKPEIKTEDVHYSTALSVGM